MQQDVYVDLLFLINFSMDYLCLYICSRVIHRKIYLYKMLIASAIGGIYSVISLFIITPPVIALVIDCAVCLLMCAIVFSQKGVSAPSVLLYSFLYVGISMMMGGCMTAIFNLLNKLDLPLENITADGISTYLFAILAAAAGFISLKSGQVIAKRSNIRECRLTVDFCNKKLEFSGLCDTGNLVKDPISSKPVIFLDRERVERDVDVSFLDDFKKGALPHNAPCKNLRLIIVKTASGSSTVVAAKPDNVTIEVEGKKNKRNTLSVDALIALSPIAKSAAGYNAIVPAEIIKF